MPSTTGNGRSAMLGGDVQQRRREHTAALWEVQHPRLRRSGPGVGHELYLAAEFRIG